MNKKQVMMIIAAFLIGIAVCKLMDSGSCGAPGCTGAGCKKCNGGGSLIEGNQCGGTEGYGSGGGGTHGPIHEGMCSCDDNTPCQDGMECVGGMCNH